MILQRLVELGKRIPIAPPGYQPVRIAWSIDLDTQGNCIGVRELVDESSTKKRNPVIPAPSIGRSGDITAKLIVDNATYVLGVKTEKHNAESAQLRHKAYVGLIKDAHEETGVPELGTIKNFLGKEIIPDLPENFNPEQNITFTVDGIDPLVDPRIIEYWGKYTGEKYESAEEDAVIGQCLICGETKPILRRLEYKIKGLPGGQPTGTQIVCADKSAFESYGLQNSLNSPTCRECGEKFTKAINYLIANPNTHRFVRNGLKKKGTAKGMLLYWSDRGEDDTLAGFLGSPAESETGSHYDEMLEGRHPEGMDNYPVYILYLKANGGRAAIGMWEETTKQALAQRVENWLIRQAVIGENGDIGDPMPVIGYWDGERTRTGLLDHLTPLARGKNGTRKRRTEKTDPYLTEAVIFAVIQGWPLPKTLLPKVTLQCALDGGVSRGQAAILKMLLSKNIQEEEMMVGLDDTNQDVAYLCGRVMSLIENIQRTANNSKEAPAERNFGAVSQSPRSMLPHMLTIVQQGYMPKLRRRNYPAYVVLERKLREVHSMMGGAYPATLSMEGRGKFLLGYYHQKAADIAERRERSAAKAEAKEQRNQ